MPGSGQAEAPWFARLGQGLSPEEALAARAYVQALGLPAHMGIGAVSRLQDAEAIMRSPDWDPGWWQTEAAERARLQSQAQAMLGSAALLAQLSAIATGHNESVQAAAERHLDNDPALSRAAAGAAALALHEHALARLAGAGGEHLFMRKYRLFALGRWPLGVVNDTFHLY